MLTVGVADEDVIAGHCVEAALHHDPLLRFDDALAMFRQTGCDGVMIGRGSLKNPWIFEQIAARLGGNEVREPNISERLDLIVRHFKLLMESEDETAALHKIRTFTGWYTHGLPDGRALRQRINSLRSVAEFVEAVEGFFQVLLAA